MELLKGLPRRTCLDVEGGVDLQRDAEGEYFASIEDQGPLNCSSVFAVLGLVEYFERRIFGRTFEGSKLFLYRVARNRLNKQKRVSGDTGVDLRTCFKTLMSIGVPSEEYWPYEVERFDEEPNPFAYAAARALFGTSYLRLDERNFDGQKTWDTIISFLDAGFPIAFGTVIPSSLTLSANIPYRPQFDNYRGGQAALAVGYRLNHFGPKQHAILIRNTWGSNWGDNGNGWLPASYIYDQLACDFWTLLSPNWLDSAELSCPSVLLDR